MTDQDSPDSPHEGWSSQLDMFGRALERVNARQENAESEQEPQDSQRTPQVSGPDWMDDVPREEQEQVEGHFDFGPDSTLQGEDANWAQDFASKSGVGDDSIRSVVQWWASEGRQLIDDIGDQGYDEFVNRARRSMLATGIPSKHVGRAIAWYTAGVEAEMEKRGQD